MVSKAGTVSAETNYRQMVNRTLSAMLAEREKNQSWQDSEKEEATQSLLFKRVEALLSFLLPLEIIKVKAPTDIAEGRKWFFNDLKEVLDLVDRDGFDPNPYTYIREEKFDFVDCASTLLELLILTKKHISNSKEYRLLKSRVEKIASRAFMFLSESASEEEKGRFSWAANNQLKFKEQSFTNLYFTSYALKALSLLQSGRSWGFVSENDRRLLDLIQGGTTWLCDRFDSDNQTLYSDKKKSGTTYYDFAFALVALCSACEHVDEVVKSKVDIICKAFLENISESKIEDPAFIYFLQPKTKAPVYYDNRLSMGIIVSALHRISKVITLSSREEEKLSSKTTNFAAQLIRQRDAKTNLWNEDGYLVTSTMWGVGGLLDLDVYGKTTRYEFSEAQLYAAMRKTLDDSKITKAIIEVLLDELFKLREDTSKGDVK